MWLAVCFPRPVNPYYLNVSSTIIYIYEAHAHNVTCLHKLGTRYSGSHVLADLQVGDMSGIITLDTDLSQSLVTIRSAAVILRS